MIVQYDHLTDILLLTYYVVWHVDIRKLSVMKYPIWYMNRWTVEGTNTLQAGV